MVDGWAEVTSTYVKELSSGSNEAIAQVGAYINEYPDRTLQSTKASCKTYYTVDYFTRARGERTTIYPLDVFQSEPDAENPLTSILHITATNTLSNEICNRPHRTLAHT
ncbi:MAG: hypothetical protein Q9204_007798, partial [Flavoplaca sp. TL-2023a]